MKIAVHEIQVRAGDGSQPGDPNSGDGGPLGEGMREAQTCKFKAGEQDEKNRKKMPEENADVDREGSEFDEGGHDLRKERKASLRQEEDGVAGVERRIEGFFYGGKPDGLVFEAVVVALQEDRRKREE